MNGVQNKRPVQYLGQICTRYDRVWYSKLAAIHLNGFYSHRCKFYVSHNTSATIELREEPNRSFGSSHLQKLSRWRGAHFSPHCLLGSTLIKHSPLAVWTSNRNSHRTVNTEVKTDMNKWFLYWRVSMILRITDEAGPAGCDKMYFLDRPCRNRKYKCCNFWVFWNELKRFRFNFVMLILITRNSKITPKSATQGHATIQTTRWRRTLRNNACS